MVSFFNSAAVTDFLDASGCVLGTAAMKGSSYSGAMASPVSGKGLGQDGAVDLAGAQHLQQLDGEVLLQHQRHLRGARDGVAHQLGQQVGADGVDHAQRQRPGQRVLAALGDFLDGRRLLQHALGLAHDLLAQRSHRDFASAAFKELHIQLFFQLLDGHRERGLRDIAGIGRVAKVLFARHGHDVLEFGEGHGVFLRAASAWGWAASHALR
jgi:hypothetical protein